jgi:chemotaxis protein methyltransferase CheR
MHGQDDPSREASLEPDFDDIEIPLLLEAIYQRWGYDFRDYALVSLKRRVQRLVAMDGFSSVSALQEHVLRDPACMQRFLDEVIVCVTSMFRDPGFYKAFRQIAVPLLKQQPSFRIWHAGCSSGEEVYSMAILLYEEGLLDRALIYATDLNRALLDVASQGVYTLEKMKKYTEAYQEAGHFEAFSKYYQARHGHAVMRADLSRHIVWAQHNLVTDASFNEFHLILCRNVLIYFNPRLQERVCGLLHDSLAPNGILVLGREESLQLMPQESSYVTLHGREKIYQKVH